VTAQRKAVRPQSTMSSSMAAVAAPWMSAETCELCKNEESTSISASPRFDLSCGM